MQRVLITGVAGVLGLVLAKGLGGPYDVRGLDRRRGGDWFRGDVRRPDSRSVRKAFAGVDVVVDLAANPSLHSTWDEVLDQNVRATLGSLEAAREAGVTRYVFASSAHVVGLYERDDPYAAIVAGDYDRIDAGSIPAITIRDPVRPDSPYAVGKIAGESAGRLYSEKYGLSVLCLRLGWVNAENTPPSARARSIFLTHGDLVRLVDCAVRAPADLRFATYFGVSANTWRFHDIEDARRELGYQPQDDAAAPTADRTKPLG